MEIQTDAKRNGRDDYPMESLRYANEFERPEEIENVLKLMRFMNMDDLLEKLGTSVGKKSFLVFRNHKYVNVLTENIALFYIKYESPVMMCFDKQEYFMDQSLEQIQKLLSEKQFFRLNRQYLVSFKAVKEVEHYFARKLLVNLVVPVKEKVLVSKERVSGFLRWLDNR
jgi:two-component system, LytTR family, response regulator LytT